jgi:hypothetical protein
MVRHQTGSVTDRPRTIDAPVGKSGSIVGRSIKSTLTWDAVMKKSDKLYAVREKRKLKQTEETMGKMQKR